MPAASYITAFSANSPKGRLRQCSENSIILAGSNENPAINPRDVESSGGSCVRGLGVLVPAKASL